MGEGSEREGKREAKKREGRRKGEELGDRKCKDVPLTHLWESATENSDQQVHGRSLLGQLWVPAPTLSNFLQQLQRVVALLGFVLVDTNHIFYD